MTTAYVKETVLKGLPLSSGVAIARVCRFNENRHNNLEAYRVSGDGIEREIQRLDRAVRLAAERLEQVRERARTQIGKAEAEIFTAQKMLVEDTTLYDKVCDLIRNEHTNAEAAVMVVLDSYEARMQEVDDEYIRERASDFGEVKRRLLDVLGNINPAFQCAQLEHCQRGQARIVVAEELTPSLTMDLDTGHTLGFVTERGGTNSHAAILARALGIPAVSGLPGIHRAIRCGTEIAVNGDTGEVIVMPAENTVIRVRSEAEGAYRVPAAVDPVDRLAVMANINLASEAGDAAGMKAEGIGLYRTEFEFMSEGRFLSEDEQTERYAAAVKAMGGYPVTFRLFDAGGDKPLPFLEITSEENPALGWRGARLLLGHEALLRTQARALVRASEHGPVRVLYPMIIDVAQFQELRASFESAVADLPPGNVEHGIMFEVPSACYEARELLDLADFGSVGTNDLIQYLFAVDRNNEKVAYDYSPDRPVLWTVIRDLATAAREAGKPLSVCGELAGDPRYLKRLLETGISTVSVSARLIPGVRLAAMEAENSKS